MVGKEGVFRDAIGRRRRWDGVEEKNKKKHKHTNYRKTSPLLGLSL
jgi:hypothetical protein